MTGPLASASGTLRQGFRWWRSELSALSPFRSRIDAGAARPGLVVSVDGAGWRLIDERIKRRSGGRAKTLALSEAEVSDVLERLAAKRSSVPIRLRLPYSACFERKVELPEAARDDLGRILALELERATPFRSGEVYAAHFVDAARSRRGTLAVSQLIVPRAKVDKTIAEIETSGIKITGAGCWNEDGSAPLPVNFLAAKSGDGDEAPKRSRLAKTLAGIALLLAASAAALAISRHETALAQLGQETAAARLRVQSVRQAIDATEGELREIRIVQRLKAERPPAVEVLDKLTRLLPDQVWLTDFRLDGDTVEMSGFAKPAADLVPVLERSGVFTEAAFTAPVTLETGEDKERFSLRARVITKSAAIVPNPAEARP